MIKHGNPPYLECSSKGDKRFSAFYAKVNGKTIEEQYQASKIFQDIKGHFITNLTWREAKGKIALNQQECRILYSKLWDQYIKENPELFKIIKDASGLSDIFGQKNHCCQATELWRIKLEYDKET